MEVAGRWQVCMLWIIDRRGNSTTALWSDCPTNTGASFYPVISGCYWPGSHLWAQTQPLPRCLSVLTAALWWRSDQRRDIFGELDSFYWGETRDSTFIISLSDSSSPELSWQICTYFSRLPIVEIHWSSYFEPNVWKIFQAKWTVGKIFLSKNLSVKIFDGTENMFILLIHCLSLVDSMM